MPKIERAIKDAVERGARRQIRLVVTPLRREVRRLRQTVAQMRRDLATLGHVALRWQRSVGNRPWTPRVTDEEAKAARLSPRLIRALRTRLALSQVKFARLVGVSAVAIAQWEGGRSSPAAKNRAAVVALRRLGRREAKRLLAEMPKPTARRVPRKGRAKGPGRQATRSRTRTAHTPHRR